MRVRLDRNLGRMRKFLLPMILVLSLFLVFLGMRNMFLAKEQRPRHRPRAVLVTAIKIQLPTLHEDLYQPVSVLCPEGVCLILPGSVLLPGGNRSTPYLVTQLIEKPPSRAPPFSTITAS